MRKFIQRLAPLVALMFPAVLLGSISPPELKSQTTTGNIEGTVLDDKGNPAADVEVVAKNEETGIGFFI